MSKISTANNPPRNNSINASSAWARGPPASSSPSSSTPQPVSILATAPTPTPAASNQATGTPRVNGQPSHSRRPSAAMSSSLQPAPTTLKEPVVVNKGVAAPIPSKPSSVQFGSIDDTNAVISSSPAAPSTMNDIKQIKSFGTISAGSGDSSATASTTANKLNGPQRTDSPAPAGKVKKKFDVNSLFQKPQQATSTTPPAPASVQQQPLQQQQPLPNQPIPQPMPQPQQQVPSTPQQSAQDISVARPPPKHQASYDSPSMRNAQLPVLPHQPNQTPSPMQPNAGPPTYHYNPSQPHLRQGGNNVPGSNPPRSPNFPRAIPNGNMRGPPGAPGSAVLGSPRMAPPATTPNPSAQPQVQTPIPGVPPGGVPPGMMPVPGGPTGHPPHMPSPVTSMPPGQIPGQMPPQMPPQMQMWGYYYPPVYDPNMPYYWPHQIPPPHLQQPHAPHQQQPNQMPVPQPGLATPSQAPMNMPISPRVPPNGTMQPTPQTPVTSHTPLSQAPPGSRSSFIAPKKAVITLKNSAGEEIDIAKLRTQKSDEPQTPKIETARRPVSIRLETEDANKRRREEEEKSKLDKTKKEEELAKVKAKRDAEARERARRDLEEKERRQREAEDAKRKKVEEEDKAKRDAEQAEEREKERIRRAEEEENEKVRKAEEEKERLRIEAEEKEKARLLEIEAQKKAEEEAKRKAEEEARRKAEDEARQKEEEAKRLAEEAKRKEEEARLREEAKRKLEEEEAARQKAVEEAKLKAEAEAAEKAKKEEEARQKENESKLAEAAAETSAASTVGSSGINDTFSQGSTPLGSTPAYASPAQPASALPKNLAPKSRPVLGPLDLSGTKSANLPQPLPSALASARIIEDIGKVSYPEGIKAPSSELNLNAASGKFRYDRDFLMQFMKVCKEKPDDMPALDAIGLEPSEQQGSFGGRRGRPQMTGSATSSRNSMGLGLTGPGGVPFGGKSFGGGGMGQFQAPAGRSSEERFAASLPRAVSGTVPFPRQTLGRTNSTSGQPLQGMVGRRDTPQRTQSGRGTKRTDSKVGPAPSAMQTFTTPEPELHHSENAWSALRKPGAKDQTTPEFVEGKVKSLLNKLTMEKFDSISLQILEWANRSVNEVDGRTLIQVIKLVFEKATDEATWSEMYARLCRFLMERISQDVRDEGIKNADGKPIAGGNLFRKYLLNRCQEDFERGWSQKEAAVAAAANKADDDKAVAAAADKNGNGEEVLYSDEYYAAQKAKRRGLGLVKFIGELFKLQMLTERIMHECIKKLLSNVENPEEEEIESLCKLLATVGQALDTVKARNHMDIYFSRMQELANSGQISSRIQFMLLDIVELRSRKWVPRNQVSAPTTIAEVHQKAERDRQTAEREAALRQAGGRDHLRNSRRETRDFTPSQDGWTTPTSSKPPNKGVGDLSNFGKIQKSNTMQFGPSSIFSKKEKRESTSATRNSSSSNMFAALNSSEATPDAASVGSRTANSTRPPSRKGSIDFGAGSVADSTPQRRRLMLQPRTVASDAGSFRDDAGSAIGQSEAGDDESVGAAAGSAKGTMSSEQAKRKIKEDVKELFMLRQLSEAEGYFTGLPTEFRVHLVKELVNKAMDARATDVQLIADVFGLVADKSLVEEEQFIEGFSPDMEYLEDTSTDSPNAYGNIATLLKAAKLSQAAVERLADMIIVEGEFAVTPKEKLLKKHAALTT